MSKNEELRVEIIQFHHDVLATKHEERQKIIKLVTRNYQWPGVIKNMEKYVDRYDICQRIKNHIEALAEKLMANKVQEKSWIHLIVDFITKFPLVVKKDIILVVYNRLSKIAHFVAIIERTSAERLVRKKV